MIIEIKAFFAQHKLVSTRQLTSTFSLHASALEPMLQHWIKKGLIKAYRPCNDCQLACHSCANSKINWYQWCASD